MKLNVLFASVLLAVSTQVFAEDAAKAADPAAAIAAAEAAHKAAKDVGFEWRDTAKMIKNAKAAAEAGDAAKAIKLANAAKLQGDMGVKQAEVAKNAGPRF